MTTPIFVDSTVLDLLADHVLGKLPVPPEHEWAVDDLHFLLERFEGQLSFAVAAPLTEEHQAVLEAVAQRHQIPWTPWLAPPTAEETARFTELGVPAARAPWVAACARHQVRYFLQAFPPADDTRDRVLRAGDVYVVDPMNCLSHLHARMMRRTGQE